MSDYRPPMMISDRMTPPVLAAFVAVAISCGAGGDDPGEPAIPILIAGTANALGEGFVPVSDGDEVSLIPGTQGGFHVWISVRIQGVDGDFYLTHDARRVSDGQLVLRGLPRAIAISQSQDRDTWWESPRAGPAFMCPVPIGLGIVDQEIRFDITLSTLRGDVVATDQITLIPHCPDDATAEFCFDICSS